MFDVNNPDNGYLRSYLLVQVYHLIFTSPLSTKDQPKDVENLPTSKKKKTGANCHGNVAQMIHMNEVKYYTSHSLMLPIGIRVTMVSTTSIYGISLLISSRTPEDEEQEKHSKELLDWWNKCHPNLRLKVLVLPPTVVVRR
ncbi:hypothetical protein EV361DRAFT_456600 [Lentinula raphanica]|nr:hypothetical protein EV361DRAFT_456600 [Lentinula raphanica]